MLKNRRSDVERLYLSASELRPGERQTYLDRECGSDQELRGEVESLLAFLETDQSLPPDMSVPSGTQIGPYIILDFLRAGGMGEVYKARDTRLGRTVAIKFLPSVLEGDVAALDRFRREARAASALNHPHICTVHDVGDYHGLPFFVMELLEGQPLNERIAGKPISISELVDVAVQTCDALQAAHDKGIIHRDIKPANIFLSNNGQVKILDFGLAKLVEERQFTASTASMPEAEIIVSSATRTGGLMGTPSYLSPEQARGEEADARTDIFSFGLVLYEMATGQRAFRGQTSGDLIHAILHETPVKPSTLNPAVSGSLERIIHRAVEKAPSARYQSASELLHDLNEFQNAQQEQAKFRTRRWALAALGAGMVSLAGGAFLARRSLFPPEGRTLIAIMPFDNIGGNPQEAFFADGLHGDMISVLNRLFPDRLGAIASASVQRYKGKKVSIQEIARDLNVDYIVEGGVQRNGNDAHITVRLIRASNQALLWNATYDRAIGQVVATQSEIAQAIARGIERGLRPNAQVSAVLAKPLNAAAHEAYLRGEYAKAVQIDPGYAAAYAGLATEAYFAGLFEFEPPVTAFTRLASIASKAIELDPTQAWAYTSLAMSRLQLQWNWSAAEQSFRRALQLNPADGDVLHGFAHFLLWAGRLDESVRMCDRAVELSPFDSTLLACRGWHALYANDYDKTIEDARLALTYEPKGEWAAIVMGWAYEQKGMLHEALSSFRNTFESGLKTASIAHVFARMGNRPAAEKILEEMLAASKTKYISPYEIAVVHAGLGEKEPVFEWLTKGFNEHSSMMVYMKSDPRLQSLRREPAFQDLLRRMGLPSQRA